MKDNYLEPREMKVETATRKEREGLPGSNRDGQAGSEFIILLPD
ncbi:MAG: hypothetical protein SH818_10240 [Saprospiraceae bacterium]|nr:hypothetical protein [Saprospiraceae bacterium]